MPTSSEETPTPFDAAASEPLANSGSAENALKKVPYDLPHVEGYTVLRELADCEHNLLYVARDTNLGKEIVLKVPPKSDVNSRLTLNFSETARVVARLDHSGVPPIFQIGSLADGRPFAAMRLIQGQTLQAMLAARDTTNPDRIRFLPVFQRLCEIMAFVHGQGVAHRDLKPNHVLIDAFGEVQVVGWGAAAVYSQEAAPRSPSSTGGGSGPGTPAYIPPEQARGEWAKVDSRADVFTLGGILFEILTGQPTFPAYSPEESLKKSAAGDLSDSFYLLDYCGEDADLVAIVKRCLNPDPARRPANAKEVAELISGYRIGLDGKIRKGEAERLAAASIAAEQSKRKNYQLALVLILGFGLILFGTFAWFQERQRANRLLLEGSREQDEKKVNESNDRKRPAPVKPDREVPKKAPPPKRKLPPPVQDPDVSTRPQPEPIAPLPREVKGPEPEE
jgi:serine/threonine protein kinase